MLNGFKRCRCAKKLGIDWGPLLKNDHLTSALIDRLTETSHVLNMKNCHSLRAKLDRGGESDGG